jgi:NADPH:quinone reductase-like Zn-dependent oxidoreductase
MRGSDASVLMKAPTAAGPLPCAAVTAWHALVDFGKLKAGATVLTLGTGGVSTFAVQFAKLHGARVIATSSSDEKISRVLGLGADESINYKRTPDWDKEVFRLTDKAGVDHVVEVGGAGTLPKSLNAVRTEGKISVIGVLAGGSGLDPVRLLMKSVCLQGIFVGSRQMFEDMNRAYRESFGAHLPARTVVAVSDLPKKGGLMTMNLTAVTSQ